MAWLRERRFGPNHAQGLKNVIINVFALLILMCSDMIARLWIVFGRAATCKPFLILEFEALN